MIVNTASSIRRADFLAIAGGLDSISKLLDQLAIFLRDLILLGLRLSTRAVVHIWTHGFLVRGATEEQCREAKQEEESAHEREVYHVILSAVRAMSGLG